MNRDVFFAVIRPPLGPFNQSQVDGFTKVIDEAERRGLSLQFKAYILATAWWESAHTMQPIRERGGETYLRGKQYYPWVGEGLVQVTWEANHRKFGATAPGQLLTWEKALPALFDGMLKGMFTGKRLSDYITEQRVDYRNARRIVNGIDRADEIAKLALLFEKALRQAVALSSEPATPPVSPPPAPVPPVEPPKPETSPGDDFWPTEEPSEGFWAAVAAWLKRWLS